MIKSHHFKLLKGSERIQLQFKIVYLNQQKQCSQSVNSHCVYTVCSSTEGDGALTGGGAKKGGVPLCNKQTNNNNNNSDNSNVVIVR